MRFSAPWDRTLKLLTPVVCLIPALILLLPPYEPLWTLIVKILLLDIGVLCFLFAPRGYRIQGHTLFIERPIGAVRVSLQGLNGVRAIPASDLKGAMRTFGVGGCFGYYGRFQQGAEAQRWYITDRERVVRLDAATGVWLVSPHDPAAFVRAIESAR